MSCTDSISAVAGAIAGRTQAGSDSQSVDAVMLRKALDVEKGLAEQLMTSLEPDKGHNINTYV